MITIQQDQDLNRLAVLANDPDCREWSCPSLEPVTAEQLAGGFAKRQWEAHYVKVDGQPAGGYVVILDGTSAELHCMLIGPGRGKVALRLVRDLVRNLTNRGLTELTTLIPHNNRMAGAMAAVGGFKRTGRKVIEKMLGKDCKCDEEAINLQERKEMLCH
jgi:hypothetical protein